MKKQDLLCFSLTTFQLLGALQVSDYMKIKTNYKLNLDSLYCMYMLYRASLLSTFSISAILKTLPKLVKIPVNLKRNLCQNSYPGISGQQFQKNLSVWIFHQVFLIQIKTTFLGASLYVSIYVHTWIPLSMVSIESLFTQEGFHKN